MANIAKLALKIVADMEQAQRDFSDMTSTISNIQKSATSATPSMKNLTDAVKGLEVMQGAVQKAVEIQDIGTITHAKNACEELQASVQRMGEGVGDDILKMRPTISNVQKASQEVEKLIALQQAMGANGHLLTDSIKKAQANMAEFGSKTFQVNAEMQMLKSTINGINNMPFMVMSHLTADILKGMKELGSEFNERFGGMPARIAQITAGTTALVVVIGLASAKMTALGISTSYFMALWKSSVIYQGLGGVITLLNTILGTQIAITAATTAWVGVATLGIGVLIAAVAALTWRWLDNSAAIRESEDRINAMNEATQKNIDRWRELGSVAKNALESLMTPAERLVGKLKELNQAFRAPGDILKEKQALAVRQADIKKQIDAQFQHWANPWDNTKQLKKEWAEMEKRQQELNALLKETGIITREQLEVLKENLRIESMKEQYGSLFEKTLTEQDKYNQTLAQLTADLNAKRLTDAEAATVQANLNKKLREQLGISESPLLNQLELLKFAWEKSIITQAEYDEKLREAMEKYDPATKAVAELAKETQKLTEKFRGIGKTPLESFKELSVDLRSVQHALNPTEFARAKNKLLADLAGGLGIANFLQDAQSPARQLAETYRNLEAYARESGLADTALTAAKNRAREALEKQSEYYSLYKKAQDSMLTTQEKLNRELSRIAEEARQWGWDENIVAKMKELKISELLEKTADMLERATDGGGEAGTGKVSQNRNAALERGTVAYYEAMMRDKNKPLIDENKKHTRQHDKQIRHLDTLVKQGSRTGNVHNFVIIS